MAHIDVFKSNAFGMVEMTAAVNKVPHVPGFLGGLNIFTPRRVRTAAVSIEEKDGVLTLIQTSERGAPLEERQNEKRNLRDFRTSRIARGQTIMADEIQNVRAFGMESELMQVQQMVAEVIGGPTGLRRAVELTHENMRLGAVQGIVTDADADGSTLIDWFSAFAIAQPAEIDFDLDNATPASGVVRKKCSQVTRAMLRAAKGAWIEGQTGIMGLCGDNFWDDLTGHKEVRETYLNTQQASDLREGVAFESFRYGGITWVDYRGTDDASTVAVPTDKAKFFPVGAPGLFQVAYAPAEFMPFVNTPGRDIYAMVVPDRDRDAWVRPEVYSYPLHVCTRPAMLQRAKRT